MSPLTDYGRYGTVGLELIITLGVGYAGGHWLDQKFATHGVLTVVGVIFGVVAAVRLLVKVNSQLNRAAERAEKYDRDHGIVLPTFPKKDEDRGDDERADWDRGGSGSQDHDVDKDPPS